MKNLEYIPGDLVKFATNTYTIVNFEENFLHNKICYALISTNSTKTAFVEDRDILPIPLTPEILEKNGWKLHKHHERNSYDDVSWSSYHKPAETNISLIFYPEEEAFFLFLYAQEISETPIRYIHQLQHILFGLGLNSEIEM